MYYLFFIIHLLIALLLCVVVLLQQSKGGGLAGAFGSMGGGDTMFGARGVTTFLHKATIYLAVLFMVSSLGLAIFTAKSTGSAGTSLSTRAAQGVPISTSPISVPVTEDFDAGDGGIVPPAETENNDAATAGDAGTSSEEENK